MKISRSTKFIGTVLGSLFIGGLGGLQWHKSSAQDAAQASSPEATPGQFVQDSNERTSFRPSLGRSGMNSRSNKRSSRLVLWAFQDAIKDSWKSSVQLTSDGRQIALGTVVDEDGWIVTKASEIPSDADVFCRTHDNRVWPATISQIVPELDIALMHVDATNLHPVRWNSTIPNRGSWLATTDLRSTPRAVGVVSTGVQEIRKQAPVLGVHLVSSSYGAAVTHVLPGTGADLAGLRIGDSIYRVNGVNVQSLQGFKRAISGIQGGEVIKLGINRADNKFDVDAKLMDLSDELLDETEMEVSGRVSARASGFEKVFMHDTVLEPNQCGGPLLDLDGNAVGINIARAGRVTSYALPAELIEPMISELLDEARLVSKTPDADEPAAAIR